MGMAYQWKSGTRTSTKAEIAGKVFKELENSDAGLTAQSLVDASRPKDAPMHNDFEWNDSIAAEKFRNHQAGVLIASLEVIFTEAEDAQPTRGYVSFKTEDKTFESIETVLLDVEKTNALFEMAMRELESFKRKYANLTEFKRLFDEINAIKERRG